MTTNLLEKLWLEIEASEKPRQSGWIRRRTTPSAAVAVHAAVSCDGGKRSLMIDIPITALGRLQNLPITGGLSVTLVPPLEGAPPEQRCLAVELEDIQFSDIFSVFCLDLVDGISRCTKINDAIVLILQRLVRWQEFLSNATDGLSNNAIVGVFGELWFLRTMLVPLAGIGLIKSWTGAQRDPQDFIVPGIGAVEVKTSTARVLSSVRIHGERQLDDSGLGCLFLACLRLEPAGIEGESLNDVINDLRRLATNASEFSSTFDRLLAEVGWMERHVHRYEQLRFHVAQRRFFRVDTRFPRLLTGALPSGVSDVSYQLDLRACSACECTENEVANTLSGLQLSTPTK
jgi:hypothetical protein